LGDSATSALLSGPCIIVLLAAYTSSISTDVALHWTSLSQRLTGVFRQADKTFSAPSTHSCRLTAVIYLKHFFNFIVFLILVVTAFTLTFLYNRKYLLLRATQHLTLLDLGFQDWLLFYTDLTMASLAIHNTNN
jgi:hypothetical protein